MRERVARIQSRISDIQVSITRNKVGQTNQIKQRLNEVENCFKDALDSNTRIFYELDSNIQEVIDNLESDSKAKNEALNERREEREARKRLLEERFDQIDEVRAACASQLRQKILESDKAVRQEIEQES